MNIVVNGVTDKRPVIHTVLNMIAPTGPTALVTSNRFFQRLLQDNADMGYYGETLIIVSDEEPLDVWGIAQQNPEDFQNVIYDVGLTAVENLRASLQIIVAGSTPLKEETNFADLYPLATKLAIEYAETRVGKEWIKIPIDNQYLAAIETAESLKKKFFFKNKHLNRELAKVLSPVINIPEKTLVRYSELKVWKGGR